MSLQTRSDKYDPKDAEVVAVPPNRWRFGLRHMLYLVFYCAIGCWLFAVVRAPVVAAIILGLVSAMVWVAVLLARRRSSQQRTLLGVLAIALEQEMPLAPALEAFADQFRGGYQRRVLALAQVLRTALPLPQALDVVPGILPGDAEILARVGWESNTLPAALRQAASLRRGESAAWRAIISRIEYFLLVLVAIQVVGTFLLGYVSQRISWILRDFSAPLPELSREVFRFGDWVGSHLPFLLLLIPVELALMLSLLSTVYGWSRFSIVMIDRLFIRRHTALLLRALAWQIEGGGPLVKVLALLESRYPSRWVKRLLSRVRQDVEHGTDMVESLAYHRLIRSSDAALLQSARRVGNLAWALRQTAESSERRLEARLQVLGQLLTPFVVLGLGSLVGMIAVAYFLPLVTILEALAQ